MVFKLRSFGVLRTPQDDSLCLEAERENVAVVSRWCVNFCLRVNLELRCRVGVAEAEFVDAEFFDAEFEGRGGNADFFRGAFGAGDFAA